MKTLLPVVLIALAGAPAPLLPAAHAQQRVVARAGQPAPKPASELATADLVDAAADLIEQNYVFPELGTTTAAMLRANLKEGKYDGLDAQQLAQAMSLDLRAFTKDLHFGAGWVPPRPAEEGETAARFMPRDSGTQGFEKIERLDGNLGYIDLRGFRMLDGAEPMIHAAMQLMHGADAIIFDLRSNGGGDPETVQLLCSYLFDPTEPVLLNSLYFRPTDETTEFWTRKELQGEAFPDTPVYVLTSGNTFSAAEEFTYNLKSRGRATIVGETTGGRAHPVDGFDVGDGIVLRIPVGRAINPITGTNWEGTGVSPDVACPAADALGTARRLALTKILEADPDSDSARWALSALSAGEHPVTLSPEQAAEYEGTYAERELKYEDGRLRYRRIGVNTTWRPLIALDTDTFAIEGVNDFHLVFERENGNIRGVRGLYRDGPSDYSKRD